MASEGPTALNDALFAFNSVLSGQEEQDERCKLLEEVSEQLL